jgi:hypothetical protein
MSLKVVTVTFDFVMQVDDGVNVDTCARMVSQEAFRDLGIREIDVTIADLKKENIPELWDINCFPYGCSNGTLSIKDYMELS